MTSATVASNDFLAVMQKQRAQANKGIADPSIGAFEPSAKVRGEFEQLGGVPVSNSDSLDDALRQIKAVANTDATATADQAQNDITTITNAYRNSMGDNNAAENFRQQMDACRTKVIANASKGLDSAYDKAAELGRNMSPSEQNSLLSFMKNVVEMGFTRIANEIVQFIGNAIETLSSWITNAFYAIKKIFTDIAAFIEKNF
ncbi:hypothetical protein [Pseudomonas fluorescens]|uniref:Uncharacterized protein n=1 Tax=Pseudomonas fluorescens TaxID=294 RepID=A0A944DPM5_PSEFL|nr:hypothetical protein [Pseudomonas fluorescens]MBT2293848.1 hypothetical protein [Pseudomonas fluorescens]MBT2307495.1 hypothetical protein [Pseudomonas fluorescens]MBT2311428.1 hypothetical protein [Pseudomonas fluorescens]MBT2319517.1 hypothetical protein [Pseudomonas fluorescens]MBT2330484.1 hypothetical protein [Pseudomonas fluorescens]